MISYNNLFTDKAIINGYPYSNRDRISDITVSYMPNSSKTYSAVVYGDKSYETSINVVDDKFVGGRCTCPAHGNCKHMAALIQKLNSEESKNRKIPSDELVYKLSENELREILIDLINSDEYQYRRLKYRLYGIDSKEVICHILKANKKINYENMLIEGPCLEILNELRILDEGKDIKENHIPIIMSLDKAINLLANNSDLNSGFTKRFIDSSLKILLYIVDRDSSSSSLMEAFVKHYMNYGYISSTSDFKRLLEIVTKDYADDEMIRCMERSEGTDLEILKKAYDQHNLDDNDKLDRLLSTRGLSTPVFRYKLELYKSTGNREDLLKFYEKNKNNQHELVNAYIALYYVGLLDNDIEECKKALIHILSNEFILEFYNRLLELMTKEELEEYLLKKKRYQALIYLYIGLNDYDSVIKTMLKTKKVYYFRKYKSLMDKYKNEFISFAYDFIYDNVKRDSKPYLNDISFCLELLMKLDWNGEALSKAIDILKDNPETNRYFYYSLY